MPEEKSNQVPSKHSFRDLLLHPIPPGTNNLLAPETEPDLEDQSTTPLEMQLFPEVADVIRPDEEVLWAGRGEPYMMGLYLNSGNILSIFIISVLIIAMFELKNILLPFSLASLVVFAISYISVVSKQYVLTSKRAIMRTGILSTAIFTLDYSNLSDVSVGTSLSGGCAGVGNVLISAASRSSVVFVAVRDPFSVANLVREQIETAKDKPGKVIVVGDNQ